MKKLILIITVLLLTFTLASCSDGNINGQVIVECGEDSYGEATEIGNGQLIVECYPPLSDREVGDVYIIYTEDNGYLINRIYLDEEGNRVNRIDKLDYYTQEEVDEMLQSLEMINNQQNELMKMMYNYSLDLEQRIIELESEVTE